MGQVPPASVLIGFGDARFSPVSAGNPPGAVCELRKVLARYGQLVETPEYRTSRVCSKPHCRHDTADARLPTRTLHGPPTEQQRARVGKVCRQKRLPVRGVQVRRLALQQLHTVQLGATAAVVPASMLCKPGPVCCCCSLW